MNVEVLVVLGLLAFLVLPLVLSLVSFSRSRRFERELLELQGAVSSLRERLYELRKERKTPAPVPAHEPAGTPAGEPVAPPPRSEAPERKPAVAFPVAVEAPARQSAPPAPAAPSSPSPPSRETPTPFGTLASPAKSWRPEGASIDWEGFVGVRLFSWIAGVFLVIGGVFFLKYSIERGWLGAPVRMALGLVVGTGLLAVCEWKAARRYAVTANALDGAGVAILFSTIFASSALWHLLGVVPAFLSMALIAAVAVALSIRRDSLFIALLGLIGGFATPVLLSTGEDRPFGLFGYLLLLNAGLAWLAHRKRWAFLSVLSLVFTTFYQWGWVAKFLTGEKLPLAAGIFLVFPVLSVIALLFFSRERKEPSDSVFGLTVAASTALPLLFALFLAVIPAYGAHWALLFGFLLLVAVGLAALAAAQGPEELHVLGLVATLAVFGIWLLRAAERPSPVVVIAILTPFVLGYLFAGRVVALAGRPYGATGAEVAYAAPILLFVFPALVAIDPASAAPAPFFGPLLALAAIVALVSRLEKKPSLHVVAALFVLGAEVLWIAVRLVPSRLLGGLAVVAVFGLFYMVVPAAGRRRAPAAGEPVPVPVLLLSGPLLLVFVAQQPALTAPPWPVLGTLALLTLAGTLTGIYLGERALEGAVLGISQAVLLTLEIGARNAPLPQVAVVSSVVVGLWGGTLFALSRQRERAVPALVGLFLSQAVAIVAALLPGAPSRSVLLAAHVVAVISALAIASRTGWHVVAVIAAATPLSPRLWCRRAAMRAVIRSRTFSSPESFSASSSPTRFFSASAPERSVSPTSPRSSRAWRSSSSRGGAFWRPDGTT